MRARIFAAALGASLLAGVTAEAAGLYFSDRGVRPLGRGGAFVAGADDGGSITYNPAGLAFAGRQLLLDGSWLRYNSTYQRRALVQQRDPNTGEPTGAEYEQVFPVVEGSSPILPIPTAVITHDLDLKGFNFALGAWAPYAAITSYPERLGSQPAPQRYSLITLDGSALAILGAYGAWHSPDKTLALGAGVEALGGYFQASVAFSACLPDRFLCAPEQPDFDAYSRLRVGPIVAPSGVLGAIYAPMELLRLGLSFHLPVWIDSPATTQVRLPTSAVFDGAKQDGDEGQVTFTLPWTLRAGVELRPLETTRAELSFVVEAWGMHDEIRMQPNGMALTGVQAFPPRYYISPIALQRGFEDTYSIRLGAEHDLALGGYGLTLRAGAMFEPSAIPKKYLSATTVDLDKLIVSFGGSLKMGHWRFDGVVAQVIGFEEQVGVREAAMPVVNPVRANPTGDPRSINAGTYNASATVLGVGLVYQFDGAASAPDSGPAAPSGAAP